MRKSEILNVLGLFKNVTTQMVDLEKGVSSYSPDDEESREGRLRIIIFISLLIGGAIVYAIATNRK